MPHASDRFNAVGTITPSYRHFLEFIPSSIAQHTFQLSPCSIPLIHSVHHIPFTSSICRHLQSPGTPFSITCIRLPLPYLEHLITLLLPTLTLNFLFSHTLPKSLASLLNFSSLPSQPLVLHHPSHKCCIICK